MLVVGDFTYTEEVLIIFSCCYCYFKLLASSYWQNKGGLNCETLTGNTFKLSSVCPQSVHVGHFLSVNLL